jgi:hypothetical protein
MFDYYKTDSGLFIIAVLINGAWQFFTFPISHEYLEMMTRNDLFLQYAPRVIERLRNA